MKRIVSVLLALLILCGSLSVPAFSEKLSPEEAKKLLLDQAAKLEELAAAWEAKGLKTMTEEEFKAQTGWSLGQLNGTNMHIRGMSITVEQMRKYAADFRKQAELVPDYVPPADPIDVGAILQGVANGVGAIVGTIQAINEQEAERYRQNRISLIQSSIPKLEEQAATFDRLVKLLDDNGLQTMTAAEFKAQTGHVLTRGGYAMPNGSISKDELKELAAECRRRVKVAQEELTSLEAESKAYNEKVNATKPEGSGSTGSGDPSKIVNPLVPPQNGGSPSNSGSPQTTPGTTGTSGSAGATDGDLTNSFSGDTAQAGTVSAPEQGQTVAVVNEEPGTQEKKDPDPTSETKDPEPVDPAKDTPAAERDRIEDNLGDTLDATQEIISKIEKETDPAIKEALKVNLRNKLTDLGAITQTLGEERFKDLPADTELSGLVGKAGDAIKKGEGLIAQTDTPPTTSTKPADPTSTTPAQPPSPTPTQSPSTTPAQPTSPTPASTGSVDTPATDLKVGDFISSSNDSRGKFKIEAITKNEDGSYSIKTDNDRIKLRLQPGDTLKKIP